MTLWFEGRGERRRAEGFAELRGPHEEVQHEAHGTSSPPREEAVARALDVTPADLGPSARRKYKAGMRQLAEFLSEDTSTAALLHLDAQGPARAPIRVLAWRDTMLAQGFAPSTVAGRLSAVRHAWRTMQHAGLVDWGLRVPGPAEVASCGARGPSVDEVHRVLSAALEQRGERAQRDHALVLLFAIMGLRRKDVAAMNVEDLDRVGHRLRIPGAGRGGGEWVGAPAAVVGSLGAYLDQRGAQRGDALIANLDRRDRVRGRLNESGMHRAMVRLGDLAGLPLRLSPRQLRLVANPRFRPDRHAQAAGSTRALSRHEDVLAGPRASAEGAE